jgi:hypothetical protein
MNLTRFAFPRGVARFAPKAGAVVERDPEDTGIVERDPGRQPTADEPQERDPDDAPLRETPLAPPARPEPTVLHPEPTKSMVPQPQKHIVDPAAPARTRTGFLPPGYSAGPAYKPEQPRTPPRFPPAMVADMAAGRWPRRSNPVPPATVVPPRPMPPARTPVANAPARAGFGGVRPAAPAPSAATPSPVTVRDGVRQPETEHVVRGRVLKASDIPF